MNAKTADWAATVPWSGVQDPPPGFSDGDIADLSAEGWLNGQTVKWNTALGRFVPVDLPVVPGGDVFTAAVAWNPGAVDVFGFAQTSFPVTGVRTSDQIVIGPAYRMNGCTATAAVISPGFVQLTIFNPTPSAVVFVNGIWKLRVFR